MSFGLAHNLRHDYLGADCIQFPTHLRQHLLTIIETNNSPAGAGKFGTGATVPSDELIPWHGAMDRPGGGQMLHLRALMESRPYLSRIPDQSLLVSDAGEGGEHVRATRDVEGRYAMIYLPKHRPVTINMGMVSGAVAQVWWYDPRTGRALDGGVIESDGLLDFEPPVDGPDWVLVLDDASQGFPQPGARLGTTG